MKRIVLAVALAVASLSTPWMVNVHAAEVAPLADEITNDQMVTFYEKGLIGKDVWVVDSRPGGKYMTGHIPGAPSLPLDVLQKDPASVEKLGIPKAGKSHLLLRRARVHTVP